MARQTADYDPMMDELPPELAAEYMKEKRRRSISEAMLGQSMEPLQAPEVKGRFQGAISPFQGLAQIAKAYIANKGLEGSDAALEGIGGRVSEGRNAAIQKMTQAMTGTPEQVLPADVYGPAKPAVPGSVDAGISIGMESPYTQKIAQAMLLEKMKNQMTPKVAEPFTLKPGDIRYDATGKLIVSSPNKPVYENATTVEKLIAARDALPEGHPDRKVFANAIRKESEIAKQIVPPAAPSANPKPAKDFKWNADGTEQVVIPGSPTDLKMKSAKTKDAKGKALLDSTLDAEIENIDKLIGSEPDVNGAQKYKEHKGLNASVGVIASRIPTLRQDTADAEALQDSLRSKASLSSLQTIRGTAGAIGTLTEREWPRLESLKATLQQTQGTPQFRQSLKDYRTELKRIKRIAAEIADESDKPGVVITVDW